MKPEISKLTFRFIQKIVEMNESVCKTVNHVFQLTPDQLNEFERDLYSVQVVTFQDMIYKHKQTDGIHTVNRLNNERYFYLDMAFVILGSGDPFFKLVDMKECTVDEYLDYYNEILSKDFIKFNYKNI